MNKGMTKCEKLGITLSVNGQANKGMTKCEKLGITLSVNEQKWILQMVLCICDVKHDCSE